MHMADHEHQVLPSSDKDDNSMDQDLTYSEQEKTQLLERIGSVVGEAYLEKEHRKSHIQSLIESAQ